MLRKVTSPEFDTFWIESYRSIRRVYPDVHVKILDNKSTHASTIALENCEIVEAEYPNSRLFCPYREFLKMDGYSRALIIHDGFIFNRAIDIESVRNVKFMWHFETHEYDESQLILRQLKTLNRSDDLIRTYKSSAWHGCMGCMAVITKDAIQMLESTYGLSRLVEIVDNKKDAIAFERTLAVLCYHAFPELPSDPSFEGDIRNMIWGHTYKKHMERPSRVDDKPFFKLFGAR
jgi:hypothetical protein